MTSSIPTTPISEPVYRPVLRVVARNTAFMLGGQVVIKILGVIFSIFVVRKLGAAPFGQYSAAMAYAFLFATLTDLGMSTLSVREMARKAENIAWMTPDIMMVRTILSIIMIALVTLSAWLLGKSPDMVLGIFIASLGLLLFAFQGPLDSVMIARERLDLSSIFNVLNQLTFIVLGTLALVLGTGYIGLLIANLAGVLAMGLGAGYAARYTLKLHFERPNPRRWLGLLKASFPFGIIGVVGESSRRFDTVFMSFVLTYAAVGWYNVPYNLVSMLLLLAQSLALSMFPSLVKEYDSGRGSIQDTVQRAMRYLLLLSLPISIGGTLLADPIIVALYGPSFRPAVPVLQIMLWTLPFMFLAEILGRTVITLHQEKKAAWVVTLNALLTVALDIVLIPKFGTTGAALVMVVGQLVNVLFSCVIIGPGLLFKGNLAPLLRVVSAGALMGIVVWLMSQVPLLARASTKLMLLTIVGSGAMAYSLFALAFKAVSSHEARYVYDAARRRLNRSA